MNRTRYCAKIGFRSNQTERDAMQEDTLEAQVDQLADEALQELGVTSIDLPDEYEDQCNYAGCFPWLREVLCAHPHVETMLSASYDSDGPQDIEDVFW
jgi:hypothetical protein